MSVEKVSSRKIQVDQLKNAHVIEKKQGMTHAEKSIFNQLDLDKNGVIDEEELNALASKDKNNNGKLTGKEIKRFLKENNLDLKKKDVIKFLNSYGIECDDVESAQTTGEGHEKTVTIKYKNGQGSKTISADGSYKTDNKDGQDNSVTTSYTKDGVKTSEVVVSADSHLTTETIFDEQGVNPTQKKETNTSDNTVLTTTYKDGKVSQCVLEDKNASSVTTTDYDESGEKPTKKVTVCTDKNNPYEETVNYDSNGNQTDRTLVSGQSTQIFQTTDGVERLMQKTEKLGGDAVRTTNYTYTQDGKQEEITEPNGDKTYNIYNASDKKTSQTITAGGKQVKALYDGNGNTIGFEKDGKQVSVAFQNRMTVQQFCNLFGCSVKDFKAANGGKTKFIPGEAVKIPTEVRADDEKLLSLKTPEQARAEYAHDEQVRAQQEAQRKAQQAAERKLDQALRTNYGLKNYNGRGKKIAGKYSNGTSETFTVIGQAKFNRTVVQDKRGNVHVISHDGIILKDTYAMSTAKYKSVVVQGGARVAVVEDRKDGHGRRIALDANGKQIVLSHDDKILKQEYVADSDDADRGIDMTPSYSNPEVSYGKNGFAFRGVVPRDDERRTDANGNHTEIMLTQSVDANGAYKADAQAIVDDMTSGKKQAALDAQRGILNAGIMSHIDTHFEGTKFGSYHNFLADKFSEEEAYVLEAGLVQNGAIQNQARRDNIIGQNITTYGDNVENLEAGYRAITTEADKQGATKAAQAYISERGIEAPHGYQGLSALDILTYHQTEGDSKEVRVANNALYNGKAQDLFTTDEVTTSRGAEVAYFLQDEDIDNALALADEDQLKKADELRKAAGQETIRDLIPPSSDHIAMGRMARIMDTGYIPYKDEELAAVALNYIKDHMGDKRDARTVAYHNQLIKGVLRTPGSAQLFYDILHGEHPEYQGDTKAMAQQARTLGLRIDDVKTGYSLISTKPSQSKQFYTDEELAEIKQQYEGIKAAVDSLQVDWDRVLNDEGYLDAIINEVRSVGLGGPNGSLGVTRGQIRAQLLQLRKDLNDLKLASEFRLYNGDGTEVSFESLYRKFQTTYMPSDIKQGMDDYKSAQQTGHVVVDIAITIVPVAKGAQLGLKLGNGITSALNLGNLASRAVTVAAASSMAGTVTGAAQYTIDRTNHLSSVTGDNIQTRIEDWDKAVGVAEITAGSVAVGMGVGELVAPLYSKAGSKLAKAEETLQKALVRAEGTKVAQGSSRAVEIAQKARDSAIALEKLCKSSGITLEVALNATSDIVLTQLIFDSSMGPQDIALSIVGNLVGARASAKAELDRAHSVARGATHGTGSSSAHPVGQKADILDNAVKEGSSGGSFSPRKLDQAVEEIRVEIQQGATPQRAADLYMEAGTHRVQDRAQGQSLRQTVAENSGFEVHNGQRVATTPQGEVVVQEINQRVAQSAESILHSDGRTALAPSDASMLQDHITHNLNTPEALEQFKNELSARFSGNRAQIQGTDYYERVVAAADKKLNALKAKDAGLNETLAMMLPGKGMDAKALASARGVINNPASTLEDLQALRDAVSKTKKFDGQRKLLKDLDARITEMGQTVPSEATVKPQGAKDAEPVVEAHDAEVKKAEEAQKAKEAQKAEKAEKAERAAKEGAAELEQEIASVDESEFSSAAEKSRWQSFKRKLSEFSSYVKNIHYGVSLDGISSYAKSLYHEAASIASGMKGKIGKQLQQMRATIKNIADNIELTNAMRKEILQMESAEPQGAVVESASKSAKTKKAKKAEEAHNAEEAHKAKERTHKSKEVNDAVNEIDENEFTSASDKSRWREIKQKVNEIMNMKITALGTSMESFGAYARTILNEIGAFAKTATGAIKQKLLNLQTKFSSYIESVQASRQARKADRAERAEQARREKEARKAEEARIAQEAQRAQQARKQQNQEIAENLNTDELAREIGNGGRAFDQNYVQNSKECRAYFLDSIDDGSYTASVESYMEMMNEAHRISHSGVDRQHAYYERMHGGRKIEAGVIDNSPVGPTNGRTREARGLEPFARAHGDSFRVGVESYVELPGISKKHQPHNGVHEYPLGSGEHAWGHRYPSGKAQKEYFTQMHRTAKEALDLINSGASEEAILSKLAEHYQYAANARPYDNINNSLFMNELNALLNKAGLRTIPHGNLDFAAMYLQPETFQKYFIEHYNNNALPISNGAKISKNGRVAVKAAENAELDGVSNEELRAMLDDLPDDDSEALARLREELESEDVGSGSSDKEVKKAKIDNEFSKLDRKTLQEVERYNKERKKAKKDFIDEVKDTFVDYGVDKAKEIINESDLPPAVKKELCEAIDCSKEAYDLYGGARKLSDNVDDLYEVDTDDFDDFDDFDVEDGSEDFDDYILEQYGEEASTVQHQATQSAGVQQAQTEKPQQLSWLVSQVKIPKRFILKTKDGRIIKLSSFESTPTKQEIDRAIKIDDIRQDIKAEAVRLQSVVTDQKILNYASELLGQNRPIANLEALRLLEAGSELQGSTSFLGDIVLNGNNKMMQRSDASGMYQLLHKKPVSQPTGNLNSPSRVDKQKLNNNMDVLKRDLKQSTKLFSAKRYMKAHPNSEMSNYLYEQYLSSSHKSADTIEHLRRINEQYGVKIFLPSKNSVQARESVLSFIESELNAWKVASNGTAKLPPVIDFNTAKSDYYDLLAANGQGTSAAFSESAYGGSLSFGEFSRKRVQYAMRHEMTHTNDFKRGVNIPQKYNLDEIMPKIPLMRDGKPVMNNGKPVMIPDLSRCKYVDEFRNAGIGPDSHIQYAYSNTKEFIAVASEGDMSKYSPEFKQVLIDFGMPEWMFKIQ